MAKRLVYTVRPSTAGGHWWKILDDEKFVLEVVPTKKLAISQGAFCARDHHDRMGVLTQLRVYNKNGRIAFERTYGKDPRRRKG